jgi:hypothetical protein
MRKHFIKYMTFKDKRQKQKDKSWNRATGIRRQAAGVGL